MVDVTTERIQVFTHVNNTALGRCLSPLAAALLRGSLSIARFLANKWFLAKADLVGCELLVILRAVLDNASKFDSVEFLDEYTSQPMSLLQMSFVVVSSQLGEWPDREERVRKTPLPGILQDKLLFKTENFPMELRDSSVPQFESNKTY